MKLVKRKILKVLVIVIGVFLVAIAINMFYAPNDIAAGGVSGIGILIAAFFHIDKALPIMILNVAMLVLAAIFLGKSTLIKITFGSLLFPVAIAVVPDINLIEDQMLAAIFGSIIFGIGVAIMYKVNASSGGTTVPPLIFKKYFNLNTSIGLLVTDLIIVVFNILVFDMKSFFYAVLSLIITSIVMSYAESGLNKKKALMIRSKYHFDELVEMLINENELSGKIFKILNTESKEESDMLMLIVSNQDYGKIINRVKNSDKDALIISYNITDVHDLGFTYQNI